MREFRNFKNTPTPTVQKDDSLDTDSVQQAIGKYSQMSKEQLTEELLLNITAQKENGTFDKGKLQQLITTASAIMPSDQVQRLKDLVESID